MGQSEEEIEALIRSRPVPESVIRSIQSKLARQLAEEYLAGEKRIHSDKSEPDNAPG